MKIHAFLTIKDLVFSTNAIRVEGQLICHPGKWMIFTKISQNKRVLVARPDDLLGLLLAYPFVSWGRPCWWLAEDSKTIERACRIFFWPISSWCSLRAMSLIKDIVDGLVTTFKSLFLIFFCLPPEGWEVVNLVVLVVLVLVGIISFFFHWPCFQTSYKVLLDYWGDFYSGPPLLANDYCSCCCSSASSS